MEAIFKNMRGIIAYTVVLGSFAFLFCLLFLKIPAENAAVLNVAGGLVLGALTYVVTYYFGSSKDKSDQEKALIIKDQNVIT